MEASHRPIEASALSRSPLTHPLWWISLGALVVNDHALKHSSLAGTVTGKLSDFAGLIVAPVLVSALVRPKTRAVRLACFASVVLPFVAIKLSATAASLLVWAASLGGLGWRIWSDWTDLAALSVLPLAWRLSHWTPARSGSVPVNRRVHRIGALLAGLACLATSRAFDQLQTSAYLVNLTHHDVDVEIFRAKAPPDCAVIAAAPKALLRRESFVYERCWKAGSLQALPLDLDWRRTSDDGVTINEAGAPRACDAVVVRVAGMRDTAVFWNQVSKIEIDTVDAPNRSDPHAIHLEQFGDSVVVERTPLLEAWPVDFTLPQLKRTCEGGP